ncbi:MAG: hypothetical protein V4490_05630 [Pseudomonadota bacterium]
MYRPNIEPYRDYKNIYSEGKSDAWEWIKIAALVAAGVVYNYLMAKS